MEKRICPICKNEYTAPPAISRRDGSEICPVCGIDEALEDARGYIKPGVTDEEWAHIKKMIHESSLKQDVRKGKIG